MKLRIVSTALFVLVSTSVLATNLPPGEKTNSYYGERFYQLIAEGVKDGELRLALHTVLTSSHKWRQGKFDEIGTCQVSGSGTCYRHRTYSYRKARQFMFGDIYLMSRNGQYATVDVYCEREYMAGEFKKGRPPGPQKIPDPRILNTEHAWPQSFFSRKFSKKVQKSDLNILFPVSSRINSIRSNLEFGEVYRRTKATCSSSNKGYALEGNQQVYFEPPDSIKGDIARSLFYFSVRYHSSISQVQEIFLRRWNRLDPVDAFEKYKQEKIYQIQGNRNPFVDHSWLAEQITDF